MSFLDQTVATYPFVKCKALQGRSRCPYILRISQKLQAAHLPHQQLLAVWLKGRGILYACCAAAVDWTSLRVADSAKLVPNETVHANRSHKVPSLYLPQTSLQPVHLS